MSTSKLKIYAGCEIFVDQIMLYPESQVKEIIAVKSRAMQMLGGFSTGFGVFGSPLRVLTGAIILGSIEKIISDQTTQKGIALMRTGETMTDELKKSGVFYDVDKILNIEQPNPSKWKVDVPREEEISFAGWDDYQVEKYCSERNIPIENFIKKTRWDSKRINNYCNAVVKSGYVYDGDPYIAVKSVGNLSHIKAEDITLYQFI